MTILLTVLATVLLFGLLITIHELGHYLVARASGVGIIEFSIGMGPKIHSWEGKVNLFSLRALPIGGYVRMVGEPGEADPGELSYCIGKKSITEVPIWKRMLIVLAGPFMNVLLSFLLMLTLVSTSEVLASTTVAKFMDENTSADYGLMENDEILKIGGKRIHCFSELSYQIMADGSKPVDILVRRNGEEVLLPSVVFGTTEERGVSFGKQDFLVYRKQKTVGNVLYESFWQGCATVYITVDSLVDTFKGKYGIDAIGGPVAIGGEVGETIEASEGIADTLRNLGSLLVTVSVSLGVCNLLPLPALDGGRFLLYLLEAIRRKPLEKKTEEALTGGCMLLLLLLMAFVFVKDIVQLF